MPWEASFFATHAPMPAEPPVTTAISLLQFQALLSTFHFHLFSAKRFNTELKSTTAHNGKAHRRCHCIVSS
jgi:hypothetical protein